MRIPLYPTAIILFILLSTSTALNVALFPSTGCYSHDMMMRQIGSGFNSSQDQVTWIQTFLYDFGFNPMKIPGHWDRISVNGTDDEGRQLMQEAGSLLWEQNVPTDSERAWDLKGSFQFFEILERHQSYCEQMLQEPNFIEYMKKQTADVVVLDHFLQECIGGLSHLFNSSVVQFSNWPIADRYITSLNVPANPSALPKTCTPFSGLGMSFGERVANFLFHNIIVVTRYIQIHVLNSMFARYGYPELSAFPSNDSSCSFSCMEVSSDQKRTNNTLDKKVNRPLSHLKHRQHIYVSLDSAAVADRLQVARLAHPMVDWQRLAQESFVLVSFGSVAQANSDIEGRLRDENITMAGNIILLPWAPIKEFLAHTNLQYIICHGGINTMNELLLFGVPVIGVPLQGDQGSNLRRLVDLGAAVVVPTIHLRTGKLAVAMRKIENDLDR